MSFARPIKTNRRWISIDASVNGDESVGKEREGGKKKEKKRKKRSIAESHSLMITARTLVKAQSDRVKENDTVNDLFAFLRSFTEALAEPLLRAWAASHHIQHETGRVYGPSRDCSWCCIRTWNREEKRTSLKSVLWLGEKWNSTDSLMKCSKIVTIDMLISCIEVGLQIISLFKMFS